MIVSPANFFAQAGTRRKIKHAQKRTIDMVLQKSSLFEVGEETREGIWLLMRRKMDDFLKLSKIS
jgi:hypothetical protein